MEFTGSIRFALFYMFVGGFLCCKAVQSLEPPLPKQSTTSHLQEQRDIASNDNPTNALFDAVSSDDPEATRDVIMSGADINARNAVGFSPLHVAAAEGHVKAMSVLLMSKANKELANNDGDRPLHVAAANGSSVAAGILVVAGADLHAKAKDGFTPVMRAVGHNSTLVLLRALSYFQVRGGNGANGNANATGALLDAVQRNDPLSARDAIENGADIEGGRGGWTALYWAVYYGSVQVSCVLLRAGADKEAVTSANDRPLHFAAALGRDGGVALLAVAGADLHSRGEGDMTPLQWAAHYGCTSTTALLRSLGG